jgi:hypothetical protein
MLNLKIITNDFRQFAIWSNTNMYFKRYSIGFGYKVLIITRNLKENN